MSRLRGLVVRGGVRWRDVRVDGASGSERCFRDSVSVVRGAKRFVVWTAAGEG